MWLRPSLFRAFMYAGYAISLVVGLLLGQLSPLFYGIFSIAWLGLYILGRYLFKRWERSEERKMKEDWEARRANIMEQGEAIVVDLSKCEIKYNNYVNEVDGLSYPAMATADLPSYAYNNVQKVPVTQSVIVYEHFNNGAKETYYSPGLNIDHVSLSFLLDAQKQTMLYVYKPNRNIYFFDLDFLA